MSATHHTLTTLSGLGSISRNRIRAEANRFVASYNEHSDVSEVSYDSVTVDDYIVFGSLDRLPTEGITAGEKLDLSLTTRSFDNLSRDSAMVLAFLMVLDHTFEFVDLEVRTTGKVPFLHSALEIARRHCPNLPSPRWMPDYVDMDSSGIPGWMDFRS